MSTRAETKERDLRSRLEPEMSPELARSLRVSAEDGEASWSGAAQLASMLGIAVGGAEALLVGKVLFSLAAEKLGESEREEPWSKVSTK